MLIGDDGRIELANPAARCILGITEADTVWPPHITTYDADGRAQNSAQNALFDILRRHAPRTGHIMGIDRLSDGQRVWLSANSRLLTLSEQRSSAVLVSFTDITDQRTVSQRLAYEAAHDSLTGLPNRAHLEARIKEYLNLEHPDVLGAVLFIDLDNFKIINDSLGHHIGDIVLRIAAQRFTHALRPSDIVGRFGGDEFVVIVSGHVTDCELDDISSRLHAVLAEPAAIDGVTFTIKASIGITKNQNGDQRNGFQMLRDADTAMYEAKSAGGATSRYFTTELAPATVGCLSHRSDAGIVQPFV